MVSILIVDDEPLIRRGIESMIAWEEMGCRLIGQAGNGEEGLLKIRKEAPDIVFTDIKMPKMDGISMMKETMKEDNPPVFVVLSSYNDFELVRSAMKIGAMDYLIKLNIEEEELTAVLKEAIKQREGQKGTKREKEEENSVFKQKFISELLKFHPDKEMWEKVISPSFVLEKNRVYQILYIEGTTDFLKENDFAQNFIINICKEQIPTETEAYGCVLDEKSAAFYLEYEEVHPISRELLLSKCQAMIAGIKLYLNQNCLIGLSAKHRNIVHLSRGLDEALTSISYRMSGAEQSVHFYENSLSISYLKRHLERVLRESDFAEGMEGFFALFKKFLEQKGDKKECWDFSWEILKEIEGSDPGVCAYMRQYFGREYLLKEEWQKLIQDQYGLPAWTEQMEKCLASYGENDTGEIFRYKVKRAQKYIYDNRFSKLSLNEIAEKLEITPSYLSRIFKKVLQKSFSDYVAEVKMKEAQKLLLENNNRVYEVSQMLGYDDPYYFSKVFKKVTQMTPSEYIGKT